MPPFETNKQYMSLLEAGTRSSPQWGSTLWAEGLPGSSASPARLQYIHRTTRPGALGLPRQIVDWSSVLLLPSKVYLIGVLGL